ncbi:MBOAT family protein [Sphingomonas sp. AR_OL41]|uniref:MBOAT family O-acyltransferase n=1 Tax=Sphingomonas sp. AR_OL41 TaxID=3042729 RepID=UPI00248089EB|nr:MBOAT family protein [Sphingomonas sp. AR_OL41]MDH7974959.1 MBOAT family protein [Sphingomonas sp. AR_OL41]
MLFNSVPFIFVFLPGTLLGFFLIGRTSLRAAVLWLGAASLAFYAYWDVWMAPILIGSIVFNYLAGYGIFLAGASDPRRARPVVALAIGADLLALGYWKYSYFVTSNLAPILGFDNPVAGTVLPLGISFFTFTQIAYLADVYQRKVPAYQFSRYFVFVTYFPHLIAGPIIHHGNIMPQLGRKVTFRPRPRNLALGLTIFVVGLVKKVVIADLFAPVASMVFGRAAIGLVPNFGTAWTGALAYTLQLYFDFSGYSDMAVGLSLMFNILLPINFFSPYKARSIVDFWRRWHMSLSSFLRDYLYIPLGGRNRRYRNLFLTMLLGGIWHGAGWTYVLWGALHGVYLVINHAFRVLWHPLNLTSLPGRSAALLVSGGLTFTCVVVGWVFFRADSVPSALLMLRGMVGACDAGCFTAFEPSEVVPNAKVLLAQLAAALAAVWLLPNTYQIISTYRPFRGFDTDAIPTIARSIRWRPDSWIWTIAIGAAAGIAIVTIFANPASEFLYFQF